MLILMCSVVSLIQLVSWVSIKTQDWRNTQWKITRDFPCPWKLYNSRWLRTISQVRRLLFIFVNGSKDRILALWLVHKEHLIVPSDSFALIPLQSNIWLLTITFKLLCIDSRVLIVDCNSKNNYCHYKNLMAIVAFVRFYVFK